MTPTILPKCSCDQLFANRNCLILSPMVSMALLDDKRAEAYLTSGVNKLTFFGTMFTSDAMKVFGSAAEIATVLGISRQAVSQWADLVPPLSAARLAKASDGKLEFDPDLYDQWNRQQGVA